MLVGDAATGAGVACCAASSTDFQAAAISTTPEAEGIATSQGLYLPLLQLESLWLDLVSW